MVIRTGQRLQTSNYCHLASEPARLRHDRRPGDIAVDDPPHGNAGLHRLARQRDRRPIERLHDRDGDVPAGDEEPRRRRALDHAPGAPREFGRHPLADCGVRQPPLAPGGERPIDGVPIGRARHHRRLAVPQPRRRALDRLRGDVAGHERGRVEGDDGVLGHSFELSERRLAHAPDDAERGARVHVEGVRRARLDAVERQAFGEAAAPDVERVTVRDGGGERLQVPVGRRVADDDRRALGVRDGIPDDRGDGLASSLDGIERHGRDRSLHAVEEIRDRRGGRSLLVASVLRPRDGFAFDVVDAVLGRPPRGGERGRDEREGRVGRAERRVDLRRDVPAQGRVDLLVDVPRGAHSTASATATAARAASSYRVSVLTLRASASTAGASAPFPPSGTATSVAVA
ncbi:hypothetical protein MBEHAL_2007 [Halarchaeum acidiphilum MH1-52-1]|uniref:Uncharacterized protein n=1 Tax=Halarchaeum acidiphilum MH1-52-1 TaxID=1261545 RepID=U2YWT4_9EURY|nr:hypothetical protein MBEHAL_2007 [Halarchaeum acidiphilum MH1-52-1]